MRKKELKERLYQQAATNTLISNTTWSEYHYDSIDLDYSGRQLALDAMENSKFIMNKIGELIEDL